MPSRVEIGEGLAKELKDNPLPLDIGKINTEPITAREILLMSYFIMPYAPIGNMGYHYSDPRNIKREYIQFCYPSFETISKENKDAINRRLDRILVDVMKELPLIHKKRTEGRRLSKNSEPHAWNNHSKTEGYKRVLMEDFLGSNGHPSPPLNILEQMAILYMGHNGKMTTKELFSKLGDSSSLKGGFRKSKRSKNHTKRNRNSRKSKSTRRRRV